MKVSIDGILGTAQKINSQKELEDNNQNKKEDRRKNGFCFHREQDQHAP